MLQYFADKISDASANPDARWKMIRSMLHSSVKLVQTSCLLANDFSMFFINKVSTINSNIASLTVNLTEPYVPPPPPSPTFLSDFSPVSLQQASAVILGLHKASPVDIIPVFLLKSCNSVFSLILMNLANCSFSAGKFPVQFKGAQVIPLLKKPTLAENDLASYRPISNLRTMAKLLERLAQAQ